MDEFYRRLTRWIVTGNQPFTEVENPEFIDLLSYVKPALQGHIVKSQAIENRVLSHAGTLRRSTKKYLSALPGLMAIACDGWTSSNRIAFLAITGSWITHDWRLEETLLDFVALKGAHDGQNMATAVSAVLSELGLEDKLVALVSDNVSSNGTLVRHLSTQLKQSSPNSRWDQDRGRIRCLAHIIHLAVMELLKGVKAIPLSTDSRDFDPSDLSLTPEAAEAFVAEDNNEAAERDDSTTVDPMVNLSSAVDKVCLVYCHPMPMCLPVRAL